MTQLVRKLQMYLKAIFTYVYDYFTSVSKCHVGVLEVMILKLFPSSIQSWTPSL